MDEEPTADVYEDEDGDLVEDGGESMEDTGDAADGNGEEEVAEEE